jgi:hypothetical protein
MKAFLVHYSGVQQVFLSEDGKTNLNQRLNELLRENILQRSFLSDDQNEIWLYLYAEDQELVDMIVESINPLSGISKRIITLQE